MNDNITLGPEELDAIGEIGNISMGAAATALSVLLNRRINITSPVSRIITRQELYQSFAVPHLLIQVEYTQGLEGTVLLVMRLTEAAVLADLMLGGDGLRSVENLSDLEISAAAEVMNQMIGSSSTSMASVFSRAIGITPPVARIIDSRELQGRPLSLDEQVVSVNFRIRAHDLIDSSIIQILSLSTARTQASFLLSQTVPA